MWKCEVLIVIACLALSASALWSCSSDVDCSGLAGAVCTGGVCGCGAGTQPALGGTVCAPVAPYFTSECVEDFQCSRLFTSFQCSRDDSNQAGSCGCQSGTHYYLGRCWPSRDFGSPCERDEQCQNSLRSPGAMSCAGVCICAEGHYLRQRGECRRLGLAVGDGCVLDVDCQFENGACNRISLLCYDTTAVPEEEEEIALSYKNATSKMAASKMAARQHGVACAGSGACQAPFECNLAFGICICPVGYYGSDDGTTCLAELGSPATEAQCVGLLAEVQSGVCTCPANFFYDENMRDCVKATLRLTDSCLSDAMCHTFGAASVCGEPVEPWGFRSCSCIPELAVWDEDRSMCRLFVGIGEECEVDSDCLAGDVEILCQADDQGTRRCACPDGLTAFEGLCVSTGLELGDACQVTQECTGFEHSACVAGVCACAADYLQSGDLCAPEIGGACAADADCLVPNTVCSTVGGNSTCQCTDGYTEYDSECWTVSAGLNGSCEVSAQCSASLGAGSACVAGACACVQDYHFRGGRCWPQTGLFAVCERSSECYLGAETDRTVCRNGLCQCDFTYPYSEELNTCVSCATTIIGNVAIIVSALVYLMSS